MAPQLWTIKESEGKGKGVFAAQDMKPGTVIMVEKAALTARFPVATPSFGALDTYIIQAFSRLTKPEQDRLLDLHPGPQSRHQGFAGTYWANAFGNADRRGGSIFLNLSRVNHSCVPNAAVCDQTTPGVLSHRRDLIADKPIKAGEEIHIGYTPWYEAMPARHRARPMLERYGFVCSCPSCALLPPQAQISDARRSIIGAINRALEGYKPDDFKWLDELREPLHPGYPDEIHPTQRLEQLDQPLSLMQKTAYHFLLGVCREVEGIDLYPAISAYGKAAVFLFQQVTALDDIIVLLSVDILRTWMEDFIQSMARIRGEDYFETVGLRSVWESDMKTAFQVRMGLLFIDRWVGVNGNRKGMPFALQTGRQGEPAKIDWLSQEECKKILRSRDRRK